MTTMSCVCLVDGSEYDDGQVCLDLKDVNP